MYSDNPNPTMRPPAYPSVAGQAQPDLNLAGVSTPRTDLSGGNFADSTPPQNIDVPPLSSDDPNVDIHMLGIDPSVNYYMLNLAGSELNIPSPASLAAPTAEAPVNAPTFSGPHFEVPPNKPFDLTGPGIDALPPLMPEPQVADLLHAAQPAGLMTIAASSNPMVIDAMVPDFSDYDRPDGLLMADPLAVDPLQPDLQSPATAQQVTMPDRPGDLGELALQTMHMAATYQQLDHVPYNEVFMNQDGMNSTRRRHFDLLMRGLDGVER